MSPTKETFTSVTTFPCKEPRSHFPDHNSNTMYRSINNLQELQDLKEIKREKATDTLGDFFSIQQKFFSHPVAFYV